jgi:tetratricopeptide (TPR) repeat protein
MSLSICLVTRNAEPTLERLLRSVAPLNAEIIVGDTGSTDATTKLARSLGATVVDINWNDDFAAAQNQILEQAKGDWVFWLNPDEELVSPDAERLASLLDQPEVFAYQVRVRHLTKANEPGRAMETLHPRLFRGHPEARFVGRLHPHFAGPLDVLAKRFGQRIAQADLLVARHAYTSVITPDKLRWVNRLLELELTDRPGQIHYLIEYGRNLLLLNDPHGHVVLAQAADLVLVHQDAPTAPSATVGSLFEYLLTVAPEQARARVSLAQIRELALRWFPRTPPVIWALAKRAFQAEDFQEAAAHLENLVQLGQTGTFDPAEAFDPSLVGEPAILNLGRCYLRLGNLDRADECFQRLLKSPAHIKEATDGIAMSQALRQRV